MLTFTGTSIPHRVCFPSFNQNYGTYYLAKQKERTTLCLHHHWVVFVVTRSGPSLHFQPADESNRSITIKAFSTNQFTQNNMRKCNIGMYGQIGKYMHIRDSASTFLDSVWRFILCKHERLSSNNYIEQMRGILRRTFFLQVIVGRCSRTRSHAQELWRHKSNIQDWK